MLKRLLLILLLLLGLLLAAVIVGPFLISTEGSAGAEQAEALAPAGGHFVQIPFPGTQGIRLHYRDTSPLSVPAARLTGAVATDADASHPPTFILLHGFTFNAFTWDKVTPAFARFGRVFAYDQIPYGLSGKLVASDWRETSPYAKEAAIAQLFAFMDALGVDQAILAGNSSGGTLAMEAALARPERISGLILVAPWVYAKRPTLPSLVAELPQMHRLSLFIARKLGEGILLDYSYADPGKIDPQRRQLMTIHSQMPRWDLAWGELLNRSLYSPVTVSAHLAEITQPVLMVTGDQDKLVPPADSRRVAEELPQARLVTLSGCGHLPQEECPDAFASALAQWLEVPDRP